MELIAPFIAVLAVILAMMTSLWLVSLWLKNSSIVDIFWGTGFVIVTWAAHLLVPGGYQPREWLVSLLVTAWGLRLSLYILLRNRGKSEDFRYQAWRDQAGRSWWWRSFFKVFLLQGLILWIVSAPLLAVQDRLAVNHLTVLDGLALPVWLTGFFFEAVGDWQLARFKSNPDNRGKVLDTGLWRYTRHPNYFGDAVQWWAFYLFALSAGGWWTIFSPIVMTALLLRVSGVTLLEKTLVQNKEGYSDYIKATSAFLPWFPKKK